MSVTWGSKQEPSPEDVRRTIQQLEAAEANERAKVRERERAERMERIHRATLVAEGWAPAAERWLRTPKADRRPRRVDWGKVGIRMAGIGIAIGVAVLFAAALRIIR